MSLRQILASVSGGFAGAVENVIIQIVHAVVEQFDADEKKQDEEIAALKEMVNRLEERMLERLGAAQVRADAGAAALRKEIDILAEAYGALRIEGGQAMTSVDRAVGADL